MGCKRNHQIRIRHDSKPRSESAAIGIGAIIIFIAMILIAAIAASVFVQTAGQIETQASRTSEQTKAEISTGVFVLDVTGYVTSNNIVRMTVSIRLRPGSNDIDLSNTAVELADGAKKVLLTYNESKAYHFNASLDSDGQIFGTGGWNQSATEFAIVVLNDRDGSITQTSPVMNSGDLVAVTINCTNCFSGISGNDNVWGKILPEEGSSGVFGFEVPASLRDTVVDLY